ncbi:YihY/virulence factor BrkB family protein [Lichenifustis flavocetrariae]|uniref:YihY/virulence factor BrkB family protein n=1 Tax=Lichenifustis flavocetrariae TaxID=2949735 RepID=A0AA41YXB2_9HYPH|nr:YihY/virulence factor BrkB family protein [Lichenifustis flavocetrariae]MCW6508951.1 YihY/virulence factor BrkB family protein [Lichenifustis flavocetrariae]
MANSPGKAPQGAATPWWAAVMFGVAVAVLAKRPVRQRGVAVGTGEPRRALRPNAGSPEDASGRMADTPSQFTARSWRDILWRVYGEIADDRVLAVAASVTFYALLALFPAIAALVSLYGLFSDPATIAKQLDTLSNFLPSGALEVIGEQIKRISSKPHGSLGFGFLAGLLVALWSANAGVKAVFDALNIVYKEKEKRGFIQLNATSLLFTIGALAILLVALGAVVVIPVVLNFVGLGSTVETLISVARWPVLLLIIAGALAILYRFGPSRTKPQWRWVTWGSGFAAIAWLVGSMLFSWYVSKFGTYNETYGSLGAAVGFMTWIWISSTIVLLGAEINAEMEHQTAKDSTTGGGKPLGTRGATMADRVAGQAAGST